MVLEVVNANSFVHTKRIEPFLSFSKTGLVTFNNSLMKQLKFEAGDKILFLQDKERPQDYYIRKAKIGEEGYFTLRLLRDISLSKLGFNKKEFVIKVAQDIGASPLRGFKVLVAQQSVSEEHEDTFALFTKNFIQKTV